MLGTTVKHGLAIVVGLSFKMVEKKNTLYDKCTFEFDKGPTKIAF